MRRAPHPQARLEIGSMEWLEFCTMEGDDAALTELRRRMRKGWERRLRQLCERGDRSACNELVRIEQAPADAQSPFPERH